jgi:lipid A 4'-phosphatase
MNEQSPIADSQTTDIAVAAPPAAIWGAAGLIGLATAIIFTAWPQIDLTVAGLFHTGPRNFWLIGNPLGTIPRVMFRIIFGLFALVCLFGLYRAIFFRSKFFSLGFPHWLYLILCLIVGPGLVTNSLLKDNWGRARPVQVEQFGGSGHFTPALVPSTSCQKNCSFVSGESSSIFMLFFALALAIPQQMRLWLKWGLYMGGAAGLMRIGMGGHFLSDVIFSGVFMLLTAVLLHVLIWGRPLGVKLAHDGPVHDRIATDMERLRGHLKHLIKRLRKLRLPKR